MLRWELRAFEQQKFLEKLLRRAEEMAEKEAEEKEGDSYYEFFRTLAMALLSVMPEVLRSKWEPVMIDDAGVEHVKAEWAGKLDHRIGSHLFLDRALEGIRIFARIPEEAVYLAWKLCEEVIERNSSYMTRGYFSAEISKQQELYGGRSTDDAPLKEVRASLEDENLELE